MLEFAMLKKVQGLTHVAVVIPDVMKRIASRYQEIHGEKLKQVKLRAVRRSHG